MFHHLHNDKLRKIEDMRQELFQNQSLEQILQDSEPAIGSDIDKERSTRHGVLKIHEIPYAATRPEITYLLGNWKQRQGLVEDSPIHIMMERASGKTQDCFVEYKSQEHAEAAVRRINAAIELARDNYVLGEPSSEKTRDCPPRGYRQVSLSSPAKFMRALFPRAKDIDWDFNGQPVLEQNHATDESHAPFKGFLTDEELYCTWRHADASSRTSVALMPPQRPFESIVSTVKKFPWHCTTMYSVTDRKKIFLTLRFMIESLVKRLQGKQTMGLDRLLLKELVKVGINCPAFNPRMKYCLASVAKDAEFLSKMSKEALSFFPFDTLTWLSHKNGVYDPVKLQFIGGLIAQSPYKLPEEPGLQNMWHVEELPRPYGPRWYQWDESETSKHMKFEECVQYELRLLHKLISTGFHARQATEGQGRLGPSSTLPATTGSRAPESHQQPIEAAHTTLIGNLRGRGRWTR